MKKIVRVSAEVAESNRFQNFILGIILVNAVLIGLETYPSIEDAHGSSLHHLNQAFLYIFTLEICLRLLACSLRLGRFFKEGWNVFDFLVVAVSYLPWVQESTTLLRLARLLRVARLLEVIPGLRVIILGITRSLKPIGGLGALTFFLLYIYGVIGWMLYADHDPEHWGTIGSALLTLFQVLTLEGWNEILNKTMEYSSWSWIFLVSFVLFATFIVLNMVIGIVINSIEEAREIEDRRIQKEIEADNPEEGLLLKELKEAQAALKRVEDRIEHDHELK